MQKAPHRICNPVRGYVFPLAAGRSWPLPSLLQPGDRGAPFGSRVGRLDYSPASTDLRMAGVLADGSDCRQTSSITSR
jgi:hypothetical protein